MKLIIKPRGFGKTKEAIELANEMQCPILVLNEQMKMLIKNTSLRMKIALPQVYTVNDFSSGKTRGQHITTLIVDEADKVFQALIEEKCGVVPVIGLMSLEG